MDVLPQGERFNYAVLEIKRLVANVGFTGYYITTEEQKKWLDIFSFKFDTKCIKELYTITQTLPPVHKNWNRVNYTLYSKERMEIEYIWDDELQNEVDKYNRKSPI